jgi:hypothetical protein
MKPPVFMKLSRRKGEKKFSRRIVKKHWILGVDLQIKTVIVQFRFQRMGEDHFEAFNSFLYRNL